MFIQHTCYPQCNASISLKGVKCSDTIWGECWKDGIALPSNESCSANTCPSNICPSRVFWLVLSSTLDSSNQTKYSAGISPYAACQVARKSSSLSAAVFEIDLWVIARFRMAREIVARETSLSRAGKSCSCSSSKYMAGFAWSRACIYSMSTGSRTLRGQPRRVNGFVTWPYSQWSCSTL